MSYYDTCRVKTYVQIVVQPLVSSYPAATRHSGLFLGRNLRQLPDSSYLWESISHFIIWVPRYCPVCHDRQQRRQAIIVWANVMEADHINILWMYLYLTLCQGIQKQHPGQSYLPADQDYYPTATLIFGYMVPAIASYWQMVIRKKVNDLNGIASP